MLKPAVGQPAFHLHRFCYFRHAGIARFDFMTLSAARIYRACRPLHGAGFRGRSRQRVAEKNAAFEILPGLQMRPQDSQFSRSELLALLRIRNALAACHVGILLRQTVEKR